jgi:hypothetical protein
MKLTIVASVSVDASHREDRGSRGRNLPMPSRLQNGPDPELLAQPQRHQ